MIKSFRGTPSIVSPHISVPQHGAAEQWSTHSRCTIQTVLIYESARVSDFSPHVILQLVGSVSSQKQ